MDSHSQKPHEKKRQYVQFHSVRKQWEISEHGLAKSLNHGGSGRGHRDPGRPREAPKLPEKKEMKEQNKERNKKKKETDAPSGDVAPASSPGGPIL